MTQPGEHVPPAPQLSNGHDNSTYIASNFHDLHDLPATFPMQGRAPRRRELHKLLGGGRSWEGSERERAHTPEICRVFP